MNRVGIDSSHNRLRLDVYCTYRAVRWFPYPTNGRIRVLNNLSDHAAKTDLFQGHREANGQDRQESRHRTLLQVSSVKKGTVS